jgi:hypothetical protein
MVLALVLAACSSTPQVRQSVQQADPVSASVREIVQSNAEVQEALALYAKENKRVDWSRAAQSVDPSGTTIVQLPFTHTSSMLEFLAISIADSRVTAVVVNRVVQIGDLAELSGADLTTGIAWAGTVDTSQPKPALTNLRIGNSQGNASVASLLSVVEKVPNVTAQQRCADLATQVAAASAVMASALYVIKSVCWNPFKFHACVGALLAYAAASITWSHLSHQLAICMGWL